MELYYVSKQNNKRKYLAYFTPPSISSRFELVKEMRYIVTEKQTPLVAFQFHNDENEYAIQEIKASCFFIKTVLVISLIIWLASWLNPIAFPINGLIVLIVTFFFMKEERRVQKFNLSNLSYH